MDKNKYFHINGESNQALLILYLQHILDEEPFTLLLTFTCCILIREILFCQRVVWQFCFWGKKNMALLYNALCLRNAQQLKVPKSRGQSSSRKDLIIPTQQFLLLCSCFFLPGHLSKIQTWRLKHSDIAKPMQKKIH